MTNVIRPFHLQLRPTSTSSISMAPPRSPNSSPTTPATGESLPSQILPHLFVGDQAQTNKETVNRLNISYILSLGLLPLISSSSLPIPPPQHSPSSGRDDSIDSSNGAPRQPIDLPSRNCSRDFKIQIKQQDQQQANKSLNSNNNKPLDRDENKCANKVARSVHCKCINIADDSEQSMLKFFDEALQFIDKARRKKYNILIHCMAGISRSPTIAIAYLMRVNSLRYRDAYNMVKQCRPQIDPNIGFVIQLMNYEKKLDTRDMRNSKSSNKRPSVGASYNHAETTDTDCGNRLQLA